MNKAIAAAIGRQEWQSAYERAAIVPEVPEGFSGVVLDRMPKPDELYVEVGLQVELRFTAELLGSAPGTPEVLAEFIAARAKDPELTEEEYRVAKKQAVRVAGSTPEEELEKGKTIFPAGEVEGIDGDVLFRWSYQLRGHLKSALGQLIEMGQIMNMTKHAHKGAVDEFLFVYPRRVPYMFNGQPVREPHGVESRALRIESHLGDRVCIAMREILDPGTTWKFWIQGVYSDNAKSKKAKFTRKVIEQLLDKGAESGTGQWRGGGFGTYEWRLLRDVSTYFKSEKGERKPFILKAWRDAAAAQA